MGKVILRPQASTDDVYQQQGGGTPYSYNAANLRIVANTTSTSRRDVGIRFVGTYAPINTVSIPTAIMKGYSYSLSRNVACDIYLEASVSPLTFPTTNGTNDLNSRVKTTSSVAWVNTNVGGGPWETPDLRDLFKELLRDYGGAQFESADDPYLFTSPSTIALKDPVLIFKARTNVNAELQMIAYDNYLASPSEGRLATVPQLQISVVAANEVDTTPSDLRTHIAILSDSIGWAFMGGGSEVATSLVSYMTLSGVPSTSGLMRLDKVPRAYVSVFSGGQAYTIDDPYGSAGFGSIRPEGRSGFTERGVLKDRLIETFRVRETDIVMHDYGLGGTTCINTHLSSGVWAYADDALTGGTRLLSDIDPTSASSIATMTNPLYLYRDNTTGMTLLELLQAPNIDRLLIVYLGGGNDFFDWQDSGSTARLPVSDYTATWDIHKAELQSGFEMLARFCHQVREHFAPGKQTEFMICGYPNLQTDDPRIPDINVNVGAQPGHTYHNGTSGNISYATPDDWYGGTDGSNGKMAPYAPPGSTVNALPQVPFLLNYITGQYLSTNIPGQSISNPVARPINKDDLGFFKQLKGGKYCVSTWEIETNNYINWYSHWGADHYGNTMFTTSDKAYNWSTAKGTLADNAGLYDSGSIVAAAKHPRNYKLWVPYGARHITNETVNEGMWYVVTDSARNAMAALTLEGYNCHYITLWDALNHETDPAFSATAGSGNSKSADRWAFIDGVHLTQDASKIYADTFINRARQNSNILQNLTTYDAEAISRFMPFFDGPF